MFLSLFFCFIAGSPFHTLLYKDQILVLANILRNKVTAVAEFPFSSTVLMLFSEMK